MLKNLLKLKGTQVLKRENLKDINGGNSGGSCRPSQLAYCWQYRQCGLKPPKGLCEKPPKPCKEFHFGICWDPQWHY